MNPQKTYYNLKQIVNTSTTLKNYAAEENLKNHNDSKNSKRCKSSLLQLLLLLLHDSSGKNICARRQQATPSKYKYPRS
ncbi:hypothetical protein GIB67_013969 [Kingdonia uniflora]|uniref:Uncharacterized protein n=1 Tax=Kingdonia uniflora TaxID=39325 RepID=A0A7J7LDD2_9MAGN|nr:hypothetical protein GIB67_013969 [Kingdonia uniflora]